MGKLLNIQPQTISLGGATDLLNGAFASLSGPVGFTPTQPRIVVRRIQVTNASTSPGSIIFALFKGASGGSASGTSVLWGACSAGSTIDSQADLVMDAGDFLTGACLSSGGPLVVNISAEIEF